MRTYSLLDRILLHIDAACNTVLGNQLASRAHPAEGISEAPLSLAQKRRSQGFMRINHAGEVCAQALYRGQLVFAHDASVAVMLKQAATEETDHLAWTHDRLQELETHRSYLNFFWYVNSFCMGMFVAQFGDAWSLGFVEETERQVSLHLTDHLERIADTDLRSQKILVQMRDDEMHHGEKAKQLGASTLPLVAQFLMRLHAKALKKVAYYI